MIRQYLVSVGKQIAATFSRRFVFLAVLFFFAFGIAGYSVILPYLGFTGPIHKRLLKLPALYFYMHTIGGAIALVLAPFQLLKQKANKLHRARGYVYVFAVLLSSMGGLYMAQNAYGGLPSVLALSILATIWPIFTGIGVYKALIGQLNAHREWMMRSIALTFAAITLRLISPILYQFYSLYEAQQIIYWSCWNINLVIVEYYILASLRHRKHSSF